MSILNKRAALSVLGLAALGAGWGVMTPSAALGQCPAMANFAAATTYTTASSGRSLAVGDMNGDGVPDIVTCEATGNIVSVFVNSGTGTFPVRNDLATISAPGAIALADFNGDGKLDVVLVSSTATSTTFMVHLGNGNGTVQAGSSYSLVAATGQTARASIAVGDFNHDGKLDLAIATGPVSAPGVAVLLGNGNGTFGAPVAYSSATNTIWLVAGDFTGDGELDLALGQGTNPGIVSVLPGNGDGTFGAAINSTTPYTITCMAAGDLNGDGKLDLVVGSTASGSKVSVLLNNGGGSFAAGVTYVGATFPQTVALADFNHDGILDIVANQLTGSATSVYQGNGDGTFGNGVGFNTGTNNFKVAVGDFNGDGKPDFVVTLSPSASTSMLVVLNTTTSCATCCDPTGGCTVTLQADCSAPSAWVATGTSCTHDPCPQPGTCCDTLGGCTFVAQSSCGAPSVWHAGGTSCAATPCVVVQQGVCCDTLGGCTVVVQTACVGGGAWTSGGACSPSNPCGVCCRGATCSTAYANAGACEAAMPLPLTPGVHSRFVATGAGCNAAPTPPATLGNAVTPCCFGDYNHNGMLEVQDIFDFLTNWFEGKYIAIPSGNGATGTLAVQNIFDFLDAWFAGCS